MHRAVLAVDRNQLSARCRPQRLNDRRAGDQALLVRERQPFAQLKRANRHCEARESDDAVDDDIRIIGEFRKVGDDLRERQRFCNLGATTRVGHRNDLRAELVRLRDERVDR